MYFLLLLRRRKYPRPAYEHVAQPTSRRAARPTHEPGRPAARLSKKSEGEPQASQAPHEPGPGTRSKVHERPRRTLRPTAGRKQHTRARGPHEQERPAVGRKPSTRTERVKTKRGPCRAPRAKHERVRQGRPAEVARRLKKEHAPRFSKRRALARPIEPGPGTRSQTSSRTIEKQNILETNLKTPPGQRYARTNVEQTTLRRPSFG